MTDLEFLHGLLRRARRRRRWYRAWVGIWHGLFAGAVVALLGMAAFKVLPLPEWVPGAAAGCGAGVMAAVMLVRLCRRDSPAGTARWLDQQQGLQERVATAVEFTAEGREETDWGRLVVRDAAEHVRGVRLSALLPFGLPRISRWALIMLALLMGLGWVPEYRSKASQEAQLEKQIMQETGREMVEVIRRELARPIPRSPEVQNSLEESIDLGEKMKRVQLSRLDAMKELARVTDSLRRHSEKLARDPAIQRMRQAARERSSTSAEALQRRIQRLQEQLGKAGENPARLAGLQQKLKNLRRQAAAMSASNSGLSSAEQNQLSRSLAALQQEAMQMGIQMESLDAAMEALAAAQVGRFLQEMEVAVQDLEKLRAMADQLQQLQQQAGQKIGKNLAEQLEFGQTDPAIRSLEQMIRELQKSSLSVEQQQAMLGEIQEAIPSSAPYGEVQIHLQKAADALQKGDRQTASDSLQKAADALRAMQEQMGDMKSLAATMKAMQAAQMCIGNGMKWGQCYGNSGRPGNQSGIKPGRGVGTWAEDFRWQYDNPPDTGRWENQDIARPDLDPRGITDRGDSQLSENLTPDRIKGRFTPGDSMPSISLRGVNVRGESRVDYTTVGAAAQGENQSAQNAQNVPRIYRETVRAYFDETASEPSD